MTALALVEGQSHASLIIPQTPEEKELALAYQEGMKKYAKGMMPVNKGVIRDVDEALSLLGEQPIAPMAVPVTYTAYREIPSLLILCENDSAVPPYIQEKMVVQAGYAMDVVRREEGHSPYLSNPSSVADCIRRVAVEFV